jgi:hypothetical protein
MPLIYKIAVIIGVIQIFKYYGTPGKLLPVFAIIIGAVLEHTYHPTPQGILDGVILGAMVTGCFMVVKEAGMAVLGLRKKDSGDVEELEDDLCN